MSTGTLLISAFRNSSGRPAEDVSLTVRQEDGRIISRSVTDASGRSEALIVETPSPESSLVPPTEPVNITTQPFAALNITARTPDGIETEITGTQVYSDTLSLQNMILPGQNDDISIPNPTIMGGVPEKIPENEVKRLPDAGGTVVLPQPVVPELIVVHAGVPSDDSAPNYTVGFTDYIKNVASSEIFATWPREAIKANVLAILSFTMNRVYTEWYRGKGYDFTITSSTAYDQAFVYGRNIFSEISEVVDEVFNLYITRPNIKQPLFTQYCDGVRVKRDGWLSQWGSKSLADSGLSAIQILRNYYGRDIIIREAERVQGIPLSFPGVLSIGSRGMAVRALQNQLNSISNNFPLIEKLAVDGIFGPKTARSVSTFQKIFNLPVTGSVNFPTWYRISNVYVAVERLAEN